MILWNVKRILSFFQCCYHKQLFLNPVKHFPQHVHCVLQYTCSLRCDLEVTRSSKRAEDVQVEWKYFCHWKNLLTENKSVFSLVPRLSTRRFRRLLLSAVARYRSISAVRVALSSKPADGTDEQTDGHLTVSRAVSIKFPSVSPWNAASLCSQGLSNERTSSNGTNILYSGGRGRASVLHENHSKWFAYKFVKLPKFPPHFNF